MFLDNIEFGPGLLELLEKLVSVGQALTDNQIISNKTNDASDANHSFCFLGTQPALTEPALISKTSLNSGVPTLKPTFKARL